MGAEGERESVLILDPVEGAAARTRADGGESGQTVEAGLQLLVNQVHAQVEVRPDVPLGSATHEPDAEIRIASSAGGCPGDQTAFKFPIAFAPAAGGMKTFVQM